MRGSGKIKRYSVTGGFLVRKVFIWRIGHDYLEDVMFKILNLPGGAPHVIELLIWADIKRRGSILAWIVILSVYGADTIAISAISALIS
jgi:hypothetical protein